MGRTTLHMVLMAYSVLLAMITWNSDGARLSKTVIKNSSFNEPSLLMATWERRANKGLKYGFGYTQSGSSF